MPTLPTDDHHERERTAAPHTARTIAESFGTDAARYDRARPDYPTELIAAIADAAPGRELLDVGAGTGIDARQFAASGFEVLAVEPDPRMAEVARTSGIRCEVASFEEWQPRGRRFDAVASGTAWHWIDPIAGAAKAAEVLRPDGLLALFWNVADFEPAVRQAFADVYDREVPNTLYAAGLRSTVGAADGYTTIVDRAASVLTAAGAFERLRRARYERTQECDRDQWLDLFPTFGGRGQLTDEQLDRLTGAMGHAVDALGGGFTITYTTLALFAHRAAAAS